MIAQRWRTRLVAACALVLWGVAPSLAQPLPSAEAEAGDAAAASAATTATGADRPDVARPEAYAVPTIGGLSGLFRTVSSDIGSPHSVRIALHAEFFSDAAFLIANPDDRHTRFIGTLALSYTPWRYLELFANLRSQANENEREAPAASTEPPRTDPEVILSLGDFAFGGKGQYPILPYLAVGGNIELSFLNSIGGTTPAADSTGFYVGALSSFWLDAISKVPLRVHLNFGYRLDNSDNLLDFAPNANRASVLVENFSYGIQRSRVQLKLGAEGLLERWVGRDLRPILEWGLDVATGGADSDFAAPRFPAEDLDGRVASWITLGARVSPWRGLNLALASDVGLVSPGFAHGPAVPPWNLVFGVSYAIDPTPPVRVVTAERVRTVIKREPLPAVLEGQVRGLILDVDTQEPIEGVVITFPGKDLTGLSSDPDGGFLSYAFRPGTLELMFRHPDYVTTRVRTDVAPLEISKLQVLMRRHPVAAKEAKAEAAPAAAAAASKEPSQPTQEEKKSGLLQARVTRRAILLPRKLRFGEGRATLSARAKLLLDTVVEALAANPQLTKLEIQAHTDNQGDEATNRRLTQARADAVREYLISRGVDPQRLVARGFGSSRPMRPNISARNREINRRVELRFR